jgi:hypothetical protein
VGVSVPPGEDGWIHFFRETGRTQQGGWLMASSFLSHHRREKVLPQKPPHAACDRMYALPTLLTFDNLFVTLKRGPREEWCDLVWN